MRNKNEISSGKVINVPELPVILRDTLQEEDFKEQFEAYKELIGGIMNIILTAKNFSASFPLQEKIDNVVEGYNGEHLATAGKIIWILIGKDDVHDNNIEPIYRERIEKYLEDFTADLLAVKYEN